MVALIVSQVDIHDPETFKKYAALSPAIAKKHGGRYLTLGGEVTALETGAEFTDSMKMVVIQFPTKENALAWVNDPDYIEVAKFRHAAAKTRFLLQDGLDDDTFLMSS